MSKLKSLGVYGLIGAGVVGYNVFTAAERDSSGEIVGAGSVGAFEMKVGDCFNDTNAALEGEGISSVPAVPCGESHDNEVYALFEVQSADFPGDTRMDELAFEGCLERFERFVGKDYDSSVLDIYTVYPTRESWAQVNDREVICAVYDMNLAKLEGSVRGLGL